MHWLTALNEINKSWFRIRDQRVIASHISHYIYHLPYITLYLSPRHLPYIPLYISPPIYPIIYIASAPPIYHIIYIISAISHYNISLYCITLTLLFSIKNQQEYDLSKSFCSVPLVITAGKGAAYETLTCLQDDYAFKTSIFRRVNAHRFKLCHQLFYRF